MNRASSDSITCGNPTETCTTQPSTAVHLAYSNTDLTRNLDSSLRAVIRLSASGAVSRRSLATCGFFPTRRLLPRPMCPASPHRSQTGAGQHPISTNRSCLTHNSTEMSRADKAEGGAEDNRDGSAGMDSLTCKLGTCATNRRTPSTKPNEPAIEILEKEARRVPPPRDSMEGMLP